MDKMLTNQQKLLKIARDNQILKDAKHLKRSTPEGEVYEFPINSYVLAKYPAGAMGHRPPTKLHANWRGPLRVANYVKEQNKYTVVDLITGKAEDVHSTMLKPFEHDEEFTDPLQVALIDKQMFLVEKILKHSGNPKKKNSMNFLTKWVGYEAPTWEYYKNLRNTQALLDYLKKRPNLDHLIPGKFQEQSTSKKRKRS
jgi:hypothetical protein